MDYKLLLYDFIDVQSEFSFFSLSLEKITFIKGVELLSTYFTLNAMMNVIIANYGFIALSLNLAHFFSSA